MKRSQSRSPIDCEEARRLLSLFIVSSLPRAEDARLRRHLPECVECREAYTQALTTAARLGRMKREDRLEEERVDRRTTQRQMAFAAGGLTQRTRLHFLRPLLWTALSIFALTALTQLGRAPMDEVVWESGEVRAAGVALGSAKRSVKVDAGSWIQTGETGRAALSGKAGKVLVEEDSFLLVESVRPRRLRLQSGACSVTGEGLVLTQLGAVELENGTVRVVQQGPNLEVRCTIGHARVVSATGAWDLGPGDSKRLSSTLAGL
jgi:hypothetical protein